MNDSQDEQQPKIINLRGTAVGTSNTDIYPLYPVEEDIYNHSKNEVNIDPEMPGDPKKPNENTIRANEHNEEGDYSGNDLDVPGSELDDADELIGEEDEENNSYSLGGDRLNDMEEDHGE
jgi:hypothetical protein